MKLFLLAFVSLILAVGLTFELVKPFIKQSVVDDFHSGITRSIAIINNTKGMVPILVKPLTELAAGLNNLNTWPVTAADLAGSAKDIQYLAKLASTQQNKPFDISKVDVMATLKALVALKKLLPADPTKFKASVAANGGISGLVAKAIPITYQLVQYTG